MADAPKIFNSKIKTKRIDKRENSNQRGYDRQWGKLRKQFIEMNPLCRVCGLTGTVTPAREVDHIIPFTSRDDPKRLLWDNLQSLCRSCHAKKTKREQV